MADFRALCAELVDDLELCDWPYKLKETIRADIDRARAALADGPVVPDGREPASVTGQPSDEELLETLDKATATFPPRHPEAEGLNAVEYPLALELRKARAVLTRWGNPAPQPPAEGEVEELVQHLHHAAEVDGWDGASPEWCQSMLRAADLLQHLSPPQPPAEGEVAELVRLLGSMAAEAELADQVHDASVLDHAADLLQRLSPPQPVPVSERLPGPEDCDAEGRCWFLRFPFDYSRESWSLEDRTYGCNTGFTHWLPAHALPLPGQEVEG